MNSEFGMLAIVFLRNFKKESAGKILAFAGKITLQIPVIDKYAYLLYIRHIGPSQPKNLVKASL